MNSLARRCLLSLLCLALCLGLWPALAEGQGMPPLDGQGFLALEAEVQEYISQDEQAGHWLYLSPDLRVEIMRFEGRQGRLGLVWYIAHINFRGDLAFRAFLADPAKPRFQTPPQDIARQNQVVYAQNGDMFSWRLYQGERPGLIIRDYQLLYEKTYTKQTRVIPPLDELALFPDGHVEMRPPGELSGQDYLDLGARDVIAFGPVLLREGIKDERLLKSYTSPEPRSALGIVGPGHFVGILVEGRNKNSAGSGLDFVAERLKAQGCQEAFALDGGQTACMLFMGQNIATPGSYNGYQKARKQQDIIGIGTSQMMGK